MINLITKESYDGFELSAKYGMTDEGDGEELLLDLNWGASSDKADVRRAETSRVLAEGGAATHARSYCQTKT